MRRIGKINLGVKITIITFLIWVSLWGKDRVEIIFQDDLQHYNIIYLGITAFLSIIITEKFIVYVLGRIYKIKVIRKMLLKDWDIEGYWFVQWYDIGEVREDNKDKKKLQKNGQELTKFRFSDDFDYIEERSTYFEEGEMKTTQSKYRIHINDELESANWFAYFEGKYMNHSSSRIYFYKSLLSDNKPDQYLAMVCGFEENYREMHLGRPINKKVIESYKKMHGEKKWLEKLLEKEGAEIPNNSETLPFFKRFMSKIHFNTPF